MKNKGVNQKMQNKKGLSLGDMPVAAITLVLIAVVLGVGANILTNVQSTQTANSTAYNASASGLTALAQLASWQNTIAIVIAAAIVIGVLLYLKMN